VVAYNVQYTLAILEKETTAKKFTFNLELYIKSFKFRVSVVCSTYKCVLCVYISSQMYYSLLTSKM